MTRHPLKGHFSQIGDLSLRCTWLSILALALLSLCLRPSVSIAQNDSTELSNAARGAANGTSTFGADPVIRTITIEVREIFDEPDLGFFNEGVNSLKVNTKEHVVRRELLFREGDRYDRFVLEESIRNLRSLPFITDVQVVPRFEGEFVDVTIRVRDTWTLLPYLSFASGGGTKKQSAGLAETNLLGFGKRVEALYADDEGRQKIEGVFEDNRLFGTRQQIATGYFDRSDGYRAVGYYGRPFRSLIEKRAWRIDADFSDLVGRLFEDGDESFIFRENREFLSAGYTIATGIPETAVYRYTFGWDYVSSEFTQADEKDFDDVDVDPSEVSNDPSMLAQDRRFSGPSFAVQRIVPDFFSSNFVDRFERIEDYNLGNDFYGRLTYAADAFGSDRDTGLFVLSDADGWRLSDSSFARGKLGSVGRFDSEDFSNVLIDADLRLYNIIGPQYLKDLYIGRYTLVGSLSSTFTEDLDKDRQLILGASTGLRGYEDRAFTGEHRLLLNLEARVFFVEDLYRLISIGSAVFSDFGGTSDGAYGRIFQDELHGDVGFGLRFGFNRSSGGGVLRLDLAFPVNDGDDGSKAWEPRFLITAGQVLNARLPNESQQSPGSNVTVRFIP